MKYQTHTSKTTNTVEIKHADIDRSVDKIKFLIYENGSDKEFLKLLKEFKNYIDTYDIWSDDGRHSHYL
jgi:hypothetical protein